MSQVMRSQRSRGRSLRAVVALILAIVVLAAACSSDDESAAPSESTPSTVAETGTSEAATTTVAEAPIIEVTAADYAFVGLPAEIEPGTVLTLRNESDTELHELVALRLPDDETRSVEELVQLPPEELAAFFPLVETVVIAEPNKEGVPVEGTGELTEPGRYAIICAIPTGADPLAYLQAAAESEGGPPEVEGGPPHFANGMYAEVTVTG